MEIYRASSLPRRARAAGWSDLYSSHVERADVVPADEAAFDAELKLATLGPIRIARLSCGGSTLDRTPRHISPASVRSYTFILQARGSGRLAHYGHEVQLHEGDLTLCDSAAPHCWQVTDRSEVVMLRVPAQVLREYLPSPEYFCGRHLPAAKGLTSTVASLAHSLCSQWESWLPVDLQDRVARHLLELIATSYAMAFDTVAKETVSAYVLRRRLEECARQMADPRWRGHSISEIAFAWGFNSASHFTRCFRERYGRSPRDYRREQLEADFGLVAPAA
jgi:AraC-like DNA-binding protein